MQVIRESTDRPNHAYHVLHYNGRVVHMLDRVVKLAQLLEKGFESDSRGIVFCREIKKVDILAKSFHHCKDHSKMTSEDRMAQFERWRSGMTKWIIATTGLMHGIDYGWVDAIIFVEMPYGLVNFAQGAGRAGRMGRPSNIFLLHASEYQQIMPQGSDPDETCLLGGDEYMLNMRECRRSVMTRIMDGRGVKCSDGFTSMPCDICEPESNLVVASKALVTGNEGRARMVVTGDEGRARMVVTGDEGRARMVHSDVSLDSSSMYHSTSLVTRGGQLQDLDRGAKKTKEVHYDGIQLQKPAHGQRTAHQIAMEQQAPAHGLRASNTGDGGGPSMSILMDAQYAERMNETLAAKVKLLSRMTEVVKGRCAVCWAWKNKATVKTKGHRPFTDCRDGGEYVDYIFGWLDFKKELRKGLGQYKYCYNCGLPQGKLSPSSHPSFEQGSAVPACPLNDFAAQVLWHMFHHAETWNAAKQGLPELAMVTEFEGFKSWVVKTTGQDRFWNGLELILWFMEQRDCGLM